MKHFGVEARARRFDPESRYGGHGGHSLARACPESARRCVLGFGDVAVSVTRPDQGHGRVGISQLELDSPRLLDIERVQPWSQGPHQVRDRSELFHLAEYLECKVEPKHRMKSRQCPGVVDTKYSLPAVGLMSKEKVIVERSEGSEGAEWGEVELLISQVEGVHNLRRVPVNCSWCRRGCKRCSKNKGKGGLCNTVDVSGKRKRALLRLEAHQEELLHLGAHLLEQVPEDFVDDDLLPEEMFALPPEHLNDADVEDALAEVASESSFIMVDDETCSSASWSFL
eukprot:Skav221854  [mRNA]  locus=scaffold1175:82617:95084:+ [translate_table: standard]